MNPTQRQYMCLGMSKHFLDFQEETRLAKDVATKLQPMSSLHATAIDFLTNWTSVLAFKGGHLEILNENLLEILWAKIKGLPEHHDRYKVMETFKSLVLGIWATAKRRLEESTIYNELVAEGFLGQHDSLKRPAMNYIKHCSFCGEDEVRRKQFKQCGQCELAIYCSKDCQVQHWTRHKHVCGNRKTVNQ